MPRPKAANIAADEALRMLQASRITYWEAESSVLAILRKYVDSQGASLDTDIHIGGMEPDGYIIGNVAPFERNVVVEVKLQINRNSLEDIRHRLRRLAEASSDDVLFVSAREIQADLKRHLKERLARYLVGRRLEIWDITDLERLAGVERHTTVEERHNGQRTKALPPEVEEGLPDWRAARNERIRAVRDAYQRKNLVLIIGSGVGKPRTLPDWNQVLANLALVMLERELDRDLDIAAEVKAAMVEKIVSSHKDASVLQFARYLKVTLGPDFNKCLERALYSKYQDRIGSADTLGLLADLCTGAAPGQGIKSVITFNYDNLLELELQHREVQFQTIIGDGDWPDGISLPMYHLHGYLPLNANETEIAEANVVLSEEEYHGLFGSPYSWANLVQLNSYRESVCLMVGISLTDANMRRMLDIVSSQGVGSRHFIFRQREFDSATLTSPEGEKLVAAPGLLEKLESLHHKNQEEAFSALSTDIIWVEDFQVDAVNVLRNIIQG